MTKEDFIRVMTYTTQKIREIDKERLIIVDGVDYGNEPVMELTNLGVAQSCRVYIPFEISHWGQSGLRVAKILKNLHGHLCAKMVRL